LGIAAFSAIATLIVVAALLVACLLRGCEVEVVRPRLMLDRYNAFGGYRGLCGFEKRGFFYVAERDGRLWLVDPLGCAFLSKGVNHVDPRGGLVAGARLLALREGGEGPLREL
jgi:hypothetical protein